MKLRRVSSWVFAGCVLAGAAMLAWLSSSMLTLERRESRAHRDLDRELVIRDVLWRMDTWLSPILAAEVERPTADYRSFNNPPESYTNRLARLEPGQVVVPSPLLTFRSDLFPLHFSLADDGSLTSPQVPLGNALDLVQTHNSGLEMSRQQQLLARLRGQLDATQLWQQCRLDISSAFDALPNKVLTDGNFAQRAQSTVAARKGIAWTQPSGTAAVTASGQLTPTWFDDATGELLLFVRATHIDGHRVVQGFVADWARLRTELLQEAEDTDIAKGARLVRVNAGDGSSNARRLTTVPAKLVPAPPLAPRTSWTPACGLLALAWVAFAIVTTAVGFTLRQAIAFGDRRARFASAVAHELRTPLTTFRMYSDLLANDMVQEPAKRKEYFDTLLSESDRLARLVENVLGYARVEDGRFATRSETLGVGALLARHRDVLERRTRESDRELLISDDAASVQVTTDPDAVGQILFNLVDNACKYGTGPIELTTEQTPGAVEIAIRDSGQGIANRDRTRIFLAFDRGAQVAEDGTLPGVGLGLALSRGLARDLGGDLRLEDANPGARFVLRLRTSD